MLPAEGIIDVSEMILSNKKLGAVKGIRIEVTYLRSLKGIFIHSEPPDTET